MVEILQLILLLVLLLVWFACFVIILIEAFKDELWKGLLCLICGPYLLYFAVFDFDHDKKAWIVGGLIGASLISGLVVTLFPTPA